MCFNLLESQKDDNLLVTSDVETEYENQDTFTGIEISC
jgi:hypothetical protein